MDVRVELFTKWFDKNDNTGHFDTASGTSGAGADKHEENENGFAHLWPDIEIHSRESGGSNDGRHLERRVGQGIEKAAVQMVCLERNHSDGSDNDCNIIP